MNRILSLVLIAILVFACKKESKKQEVISDSILGEWELYQSYGGMTPQTNYPEGNGNTIQFTAGGYKRYQNHQLSREGGYELTRDSIVELSSCALLPPEGTGPNRIIFDNETQVRIFFKISNNTLQIMSGCIPLDGGSSLYRRISLGEE